MATFNAGQKLRAQDLNGMPTEIPLAGQYRVTTSGGVTTTEAVYSATAAFTIPANTVVAIELDALWTSTVASDVAWFHIRQTNVSGTVVSTGVSYAALTASGGPYPFNLKGFYSTGGSPVSINFVATVQRASGTGTITVLAQSSFIVKQLGASSLITTT